MTPDELERALRDCLSRQATAATAQPAAADPAGTAVSRANRIHRRRTVFGAAMAAVATVAVSAGVTQLGGASAQQPGPTIVVVGDPPTVAVPSATPSVLALASSSPARPTGPPRVDLVVTHDLSTAAGQVVDLSEVGSVVQAQRTTGGWLVVGEPGAGESSLWFASTGAPPRLLLPSVEGLAIAADGLRVAWRSGSRIFAASISEGRLAASTGADAPPGGVPVDFVGVAVLMRLDRGGAGKDAYDLWWPNREAYRGSWTSTPFGVYGALPDGQTLVGQVAAGTPPRPCLALFDTSRRLATVRTACALRLSAGGPGAVSPDGRWLVANGSYPAQPGGPAGADDQSAELALVVDLSAVFDKAEPARAAGPRLIGATVWTDARTFVHTDEQGELVRVAADRAAAGSKDGVERFPVPGAVPSDRLVMVTGTAP